MWTVKPFKMAGENFFRVYREYEKDGADYTEYAAYGTFKTMEEAVDCANKMNRKADVDEEKAS